LQANPTSHEDRNRMVSDWYLAGDCRELAMEEADAGHRRRTEDEQLAAKPCVM
jgi:hypothetical protein